MSTPFGSVIESTSLDPGLTVLSLPPHRPDLHDVEFVASPIPELKKAYHPLDYLTDKTLQREAGLAADQAGQVHGEGDAKVLAAFEVLVKLRDEGLIRQIGISGKFSSRSSGLMISSCVCLPHSVTDSSMRRCAFSP